MTAPFLLLAAGARLARPRRRAADGAGWISLFDGKSLAGWKAADRGPVVLPRRGRDDRLRRPALAPLLRRRRRQGRLRELRAVGRGARRGRRQLRASTSTPRYQEKDWPAQGFEVQVDNSQEQHGDYLELKMTGQPLRHPERLQGAGEGRRVVHAARRSCAGRGCRCGVNGTLVVDWIEPPGPLPEGAPKLNRLGRGTFALQCHDPESKVFYRNLRVKPLPSAAAAAAAPMPLVDERYVQMLELGKANFPLVDLHAHLKGGLTLEQALALSRAHRHVPRPRRRTAARASRSRPTRTPLAYVESMKGQPVFVAMQAEGREWVTMFSKETRARFDYVFTDGDDLDEPGRQAHAPVDPRGGRDRPRRAGVHGPPRLEDRRHPGDGADRRLRRTRRSCRRRSPPRYDALWTEARMAKVIDAAVKNGVAIEINAPLQDPERALPAPRQGEGREVHVRHEQRRGERPRRLVLPARDAEEARPQRGRTCSSPATSRAARSGSSVAAVRSRRRRVALRCLLAPAPGDAPAQRGPRSPLDHLPPNIEVLTHFGERADFSPDDRRVAFMAKSFGDAFVIDLATRAIRCLTCNVPGRRVPARHAPRRAATTC